jgi:hypothetical protein
MLRENSRVILGDAIDTVNYFSSTYGISDGKLREAEQNALLARIKDDIQTVLKHENS